MQKCQLCNKKRTKGSGTFFKIPEDERRRAKWSAMCQKVFPANAFICADHFLPTDIIRCARVIQLMPNAMPSVNFAMLTSRQTEPANLDAVSGVDSAFHSDLDMSMAVCDDRQKNKKSTSTSMKIEPSPDGVVVGCKECETQTDPSMEHFSMAIEVESLKTEIKKLKDENSRLQQKLEQQNAIMQTVRSIFTDGQVRKMMCPDLKLNWSWADILNAICLHASGPRAYNHLYAKGFPLPHIMTLQRWYGKVTVDEGILTTSIDFMRQLTDLTYNDKICVLSFDEMKVAEVYEYDQRSDCVPKPANYVQVVMARGLRKSWKQPVFFDFDLPMTKQTMESIVVALDRAGFPVVAVVCDMGPTNRKFLKSLNVTPDKPWFAHPSHEGDKIFTFADAPHLMKLLRNHFLDSGLIWRGDLLTPRTVADLMKHTSKSDASITFKLTEEHLSSLSFGTGRQKVKLAVQLFSNTTAAAIRRCSSLGMEMYKPTETAEMIQLVNDWFDVLNSSMYTFGHSGKEPYGINLSRQDDVLAQMSAFMSSPVIPNKKSLEIFQEGVLMTNASLAMLYKYVKEKYSMEYLLTQRFNQDVLEHFFSAIRSKGGLNDHPTPKEFKYRLRKYILARNTEHLRGKGNVANDTTDWLAPNQIYVRSQQTENPQCSRSSDTCNAVDSLDPEEEKDPLEDFNSDSLTDINILHEGALQYLAGYMI